MYLEINNSSRSESNQEQEARIKSDLFFVFLKGIYSYCIKNTKEMQNSGGKPT